MGSILTCFTGASAALTMTGVSRRSSRAWNSSISSRPACSGGSPRATAQAAREANTFIKSGNSEGSPLRLSMLEKSTSGSRFCFSRSAIMAHTSGLMSCLSATSSNRSGARRFTDSM